MLRKETNIDSTNLKREKQEATDGEHFISDRRVVDRNGFDHRFESDGDTGRAMDG